MRAQGFPPLARDLPLDFEDHGTPRVSRRLACAGLVCAALIGIALVAHRITARDSPFTTEPARSGDLTLTVTATGTLVPIDQVDIGSVRWAAVRPCGSYFSPLAVGRPASSFPYQDAIPISA